MNDSYIIEFHEDKWRLVILEHNIVSGSRSVKDIMEADTIEPLSPYIENLSWIKRISAPIEQLPNPYKQIKLNIDHTARLTHIQNCHQALKDAEQDVIDRRAELQEAIHGNYN